MIQFSEIATQILARTDANGSDGYELNFDIIPAINGAQKQLVTAVQSLTESSRMSAEALRDLNKTAVFQSNTKGQISIDSLLALPPVGHKLFGVLAVYPEFSAFQDVTVITDPIETNSLLRTDVRFVRGIKAAKRITQEQDSMIENDPFSPGNNVLSNSLKEYAYMFGSEPIVTQGQASSRILTVLPEPSAGSRHVVAVSYLKVPELVPVMPGYLDDPLFTSTQLEWPESMAELIVEVARRILSIKVGDGTIQYQLAAAETQALLQALA